MKLLESRYFWRIPFTINIVVGVVNLTLTARHAYQHNWTSAGLQGIAVMVCAGAAWAALITRDRVAMMFESHALEVRGQTAHMEIAEAMSAQMKRVLRDNPDAEIKFARSH